MDTNRFPDYFTEYEIPDINNFKEISNKKLYKHFATPFDKGKTKKELTFEYFFYYARGKEHILFQEYQKKYGYNNMSSNLIVPYIDEYNKTINDIIILCHPNDCERIAKKHLKKNPHFKSVMVDSIISTTDNDHWKYQRKQLIHPLLPDIYNSKNNLRSIIHISRKRAEKCSELLLEKHFINKDININDFFLNETQAQLQLSLFGVPNEFQEKYNKKIRDAFHTNACPGYIRDITFKFIENINNKTFNGPLSKILRDYIKTTDTELYGNIILFLFAGHDTTGHTLTWLIFELCKNLNYQKILQKEVDNFWKKKYRNILNIIDIDELGELEFLNKCISEILRLYPAVATGSFRELESDEYIQGKYYKVLVPKGTYVQIPNFFRHRNPNLWKKPLEFNPFRKFLKCEIWNKKGFNGKNPESYRYSPFMYNTRSCLGKHFAQIEMRLIILYLFRDYTFTLSSKQKINNIEFNQDTMGPKNGLLINISNRKSKL